MSATRRWRRIGRIFCPDAEFPWMATHAANCVARPLHGDRTRIYFSTRDAAGRSSVAWLEIELSRPTEVLRMSQHPVLQPGGRGSFDDSGISIGCLNVAGDELRLYYMGWNLGVTVPWRNSIGVAISVDGGDTFRRLSPGPILDRSPVDPFSLSYPAVVQRADGWHMWYGSHLDWGTSVDDFRHVIKRAWSADGLRWEGTGEVAIGLQEESGEIGLSRPCVIDSPSGSEMWVSVRGARGGYRIVRAVSEDGCRWVRSDEQGLAPGEAQWESESVEYPLVFDQGGARFMLYNGNGYGRTGFGLAVLD